MMSPENMMRLWEYLREFMQDCRITKVYGSRADIETIPDGLPVSGVQIAMASGLSFRKIREGDTGVMLSPSGDFKQSLIIGVRHSEDDEKQDTTSFYEEMPDGTTISYDHETHTLSLAGENLHINSEAKTTSLTASGPVSISGKDIALEASGSLKLSASSLELSKVSEALTTLIAEALVLIAGSQAGGDDLVPANAQVPQLAQKIRGFI